MNLMEKLYRAIKRHAELSDQEIMDAGRHGAGAGWNGFVYSGETRKFYKNNTGKIQRLVFEAVEESGCDNPFLFLAGLNGAKNVTDQDDLECFLAYFALEETGCWLERKEEERT